MKVSFRTDFKICAVGTKTPTIEMDPAYTGGYLFLPDFDLVPVVIDLSTLSVQEPNIPILWSHDSKCVLGHTTDLSVTPERISAKGLLTATTGPAGEKVAEIVSSSKLGHRWEASVGTAVLVAQNLLFVEPSKTVTVNGRELAGPLYVAKLIRLCEISIVSIGADRDTHITITAAGAAKGSKMTFSDWLASKAIDPATLTMALAEELKAQYLAENPAADVAALAAEIAGLIQPAAPVQAEGEEVPPQVQAEGEDVPTVKAEGEEVPPVKAEGEEVPPGQKIQASALQSASHFLQKLRGQKITASGAGRTGGAPSLQQTLVAAMLMRNGWTGKRIEACGVSASAVDAATGGEYRRFGFHRLFRKVIQASGYRYGYDLDPMELVQEGLAIMSHNAGKMRGIRAAGLSTDATSYIFKDTIDKEVMLRYEDMCHPLLDLAKKRPTKSFREVTDFRFGMQGSYEQVPPGGEAPSSKLLDEGWTAKPVKFMKSAKITFEQMTDDDMNALADIGDFLAMDASDTQEEQLAQALLSGKSSFKQSATSPLGIVGLGKAVAAFRKIKTLEGKTMNRNASALLVPSALEAVAQQLYVSATLNETTTANQSTPDANIYQSKYSPIVCQLLDSDSGLTGGSDTDWFLLADQARSPILAAAYLDGWLSPQVKESEISKSFDVEFTAMYTFAAKIYDTRGAVRCKSGS